MYLSIYDHGILGTDTEIETFYSSIGYLEFNSNMIPGNRGLWKGSASVLPENCLAKAGIMEHPSSSSRMPRSNQMRLTTTLRAMLAFIVLACAGFTQACGTSDAATETPVGELVTTIEYGTPLYSQIDGHAFFVTEDEVIYCGTVEGLMLRPGQVCDPVENTAPVQPGSYDEIHARTSRLQAEYNELVAQQKASGIETARLGLTVLGEMDLGKDCEGTWGPANSNWCGDVYHVDESGETVPYTDRWQTIAHLNSAGECLLVHVKYECGKAPGGFDQQCVLNPNPESNVDFAVCTPIVDCTDDAGCTDGNACTVDTCVQGACQYAVADCSDNNACTADTCDEALGCQSAPDNALSCSDGNVCTTDACVDGACISTEDVVCDDNNPCTADTCDEALGCQFPANDDLTCDDNNVCTADACVSGECIGTPTPSSACNDGNACTTDDACDATGQCAGTEFVCDDGNPCTADACVEGGSCEYANLDPGTQCMVGETDGICTDEQPESQCDTDYCEFTQEQLDLFADDEMPVQYTCRDSGDPVSTSHLFCFAYDGTNVGIWELEDVCGMEPSKCQAGDGLGCLVYGPGGSGYNPDCTVDADCTGTTECTAGMCDAGTCVYDGSPLEGEDCGTEGTCTAGECVEPEPECSLDSECDDGNECTADACLEGSCSFDAAAQSGEDCGTNGGTCDGAGTCVEPPGSCDGVNCADGEFCFVGTCFAVVDDHGKTSPGESGADGGVSDGLDDRIDWDCDLFCASIDEPCIGVADSCGISVDPATLQGGDCDELSENNKPGAPEWCDGYDNACNGYSEDASGNEQNCQ